MSIGVRPAFAMLVALAESLPARAERLLGAVGVDLRLAEQEQRRQRRRCIPEPAVNGNRAAL
jgi:hypothetical protein